MSSHGSETRESPSAALGTPRASWHPPAGCFDGSARCLSRPYRVREARERNTYDRCGSVQIPIHTLDVAIRNLTVQSSGGLPGRSERSRLTYSYRYIRRFTGRVLDRVCAPWDENCDRSTIGTERGGTTQGVSTTGGAAGTHPSLRSATCPVNAPHGLVHKVNRIRGYRIAPVWTRPSTGGGR